MDRKAHHGCLIVILLLAFLALPANGAHRQTQLRIPTGTATRWQKFPARGHYTVLLFSPDGRYLACAAKRKDGFELSLWNMLTTRLKWRVKAPLFVEQLAFSPDGSVLVGLGDQPLPGYGSVDVWNVVTGRLIRSVTGMAPSRGIAFSPKGNLLAIGGAKPSLDEDAVVQVFETKHWHNTMTLRGLVMSCAGVSFSHDGLLIAAVNLAGESGANRLVVWKTTSGKPIRVRSSQLPPTNEPSDSAVPVYFLPRCHKVVCPPYFHDLDHQSVGWKQLLPVQNECYPNWMQESTPILPGTNLTFLVIGAASQAGHYIHSPVLEMWNLASRKLTHRWIGLRDVDDRLAVSPSRQLAASVDKSEGIILWRLR